MGRGSKLSGDVAHDHALESLHRHALDALHEGCQIIGFDCRYLYLNDTAAAQARRARQELLGRTISECHPGIEATPLYAAIRRCLEQRTHEQLENEIAFPDGSRGWFELLLVPVPEGVLVLSRDVTARKRAEVERAALEEQHHERQRLETIGRLAGGVAHDFNNLLTTILAYADSVLEALPPRDALRNDVIEIRDAGRRAAALTAQLLAFSGRQVLQPKVFNLNTVVRKIDDTLRRLIGNDVVYSTVLAPDLGNVDADPERIEEVVTALVANAGETMSNGGRLTIETAAVELDEAFVAGLDIAAGPYAMLAVADAGVGLTRHAQARVFEPFFTTKEPATGAGLGLAAVYGIIEQSGGHVSVQSAQGGGGGTTFRIYLPIDRSGALDAAPVERGSSATTGQTILLVEDDDAVRRIAARVLTGVGYNVLSAANGAEALDVAQRSDRIDVLLTDVVLPRMSGRQLAERLQQLRPEIRVLYMSGYTDDAVIHQGIVERGVAFISKPFNGAEISAKIRQLLDDQTGAASSTTR